MRRYTFAMFRFLTLIFTGLFVVQAAHAQIESDKSRFRVDYVAGCVPLDVTITNLWPDQNINVNFHPKGRENPPDVTELNATTFTYTYTEPGDYLLEQILALPDDQITDNEDKWDQITISVYEPLPPTATVYRCTNHTIRVDIDTEADSYDQYLIDYGDGNTAYTDGTNIPVYSYASPGTYTITIDGLYAGGKMNCDTYSETITTINQLTAGQVESLTVTNTDRTNGQVTLGLNLAPATTYELEVSRGGYNNFTYVRTLEPEATEAVIEGLNTLERYYCFRVVATTGCSDADIPSNIVCSVKTEATARNNENRITWETSVLDFDAFDLYRDGELITSITTSGSRGYTDQDVECQVEYCYTVQTRNITSTSEGNPACVTAISNRTPASVTDLAVSVVGDSVQVTFLPPEDEGNGRGVLFRSQGQGSFLPLDTISGTTYFDSRLNLNTNEYCYSLRFADECDNVSQPSLVACPMILSLEQSGDNILLEWNEYFGFENLLYYLVEEYDENGQVVNSTTTATPSITLQVELEQRIYYAFRVVAVSAGSGPNGAALSALSNVATLTLEPTFALPTAFTPDGDGINDRYAPLGTYLQTFSLYVYNRWGELVYAETDGTQGWDGTFNGQAAPEGRYTCVTDVRDTSGGTTTLRESFMLLRNR
ncbi:gliding motility-associated C-terminal domain-containing protein [Roseivirga sp. BDSF3-8]|uniref:T9SS type B sorting domain-containing protein n=1 Tax=Roseivirga sp. BDSF3-8 TaxID=3241598 RepID=UPI003532696C